MQLPDPSDIKFWGYLEEPFSRERIDLLDKLSKKILKEQKFRAYPDLISFAFFCRKKNMDHIKSESNIFPKTIGIGTILHFTPNNIPMNFALSFLFGYLSGNSNIVKAPISKFPQARLFVESWIELNNDLEIADHSMFIDFNREDENIKKFTQLADGILAWGGDKSISAISTLPKNPSSVFWSFPDRFSISIVDANKFLELSKVELGKTIEGFYNDTLVVDQNACSSPSALFWIGDKEKIEKAKTVFWNSFEKKYASNYRIGPVEKIDRAILITQIADLDSNSNTINDWYQNIVRVSIPSNKISLNNLKGKFGVFMESEIKSLDEIKHLFTKKLQTVTVFGIENSLIQDFIVLNRLKGGDRIVNFGHSLDFSISWDGKNAINQLTRTIFRR